jgi:hypothetical protein
MRRGEMRRGKMRRGEGWGIGSSGDLEKRVRVGAMER